MKTILVATDFSLAALNAARYAINMAMAIDGEITLFHVCQLPGSFISVSGALSDKVIDQDAYDKINNLKGQLSIMCRGRIHIETEIRTGIFFTELELACDQIEPYVVVMGSKGSTSDKRFIFGGNTVYAMKNSVWPLITVPPKVTFGSIKKIGVACDFERMTDPLPVEEIMALVKGFHAELHILNIGHRTEFHPDEIVNGELLENILKPLRPEYHFISTQIIDDGIIDFADANNINLLIILPKRASLIEKLIHKCHTRDLVLECHAPVMALHHAHSEC